jgi:ABC-type glycerol-3-phosphate transport system substrate-binding protein
MKNKTKIISAFFLTAAILFVYGCGCKPASPKKYSLALEIWGPLDSNDALREIFDSYRKINPNITNIVYRKIAAETYKKELLEGLASGQGPDIFLINNAWLNSFKDKILPAPIVPGNGVINEQKFRNNFVDVAVADFVEQGQIYAAPLSVDSLGLYYNKDLFNQAGIVSPPGTWNEFIEDARKLTHINAFGEITQSGAAMGTAYNINRSTDILGLLMLQNGTEMVDGNGRVKFDGSVAIGGRSASPGENALDFYTQFAKSSSSNYSWNSNMHYSIDAFSEGSAAMMLNYSWHLGTIAEKAPKLNFAVAPVPQLENSPKVDYANYWAYVVAKNKTSNDNVPGAVSKTPSVSNETRVGEAWLFLTYLTTKPDGTFTVKTSSSSVGKSVSADFDPAKSYLSKSHEPAARRDLIEQQKTDPQIGVFAESNLVAKSWKQPDSDAVESILAEMIDQVYRGKTKVSDALKLGARRVQMLTGR